MRVIGLFLSGLWLAMFATGVAADDKRDIDSAVVKAWTAKEFATGEIGFNWDSGYWRYQGNGAFMWHSLPSFQGESLKLTDETFKDLLAPDKPFGISFGAQLNVTDAGLARLKQFKHLAYLDLKGVRKVTDDGLLQLKELKNLSHLAMPMWVKDAGFAHLKDFDALWSLDAGSTKLTDDGVAHLKELKKLVYLRVANTKITDKGLNHLKGLDNLVSLDIGAEGITDDGLAELKALKKLRFLHLNDTQITNAGLVHLKAFEELESLDLRCKGISDAGLLHLAGIKTLRYLDLQSTKVTEEGIAELQKTLPNCRVSRSVRPK
ncbi:MAG: ppaA [Gemmataceae bacterium]|nr:ppaA [Gemmataceae bacterium]